MELTRMRHARPEALDSVEDVLARARKLAGLKERSRGVFHRRSKAFLHFHECELGVFADLRLDGGWVRRRAVTKRERDRLVREIRAALAPAR